MTSSAVASADDCPGHRRQPLHRGVPLRGGQQLGQHRSRQDLRRRLQAVDRLQPDELHHAARRRASTRSPTAFDEYSDSLRYSCDMTPGVRGCLPRHRRLRLRACSSTRTRGFATTPTRAANNPTISLSGDADLRGPGCARPVLSLVLLRQLVRVRHTKTSHASPVIRTSRSVKAGAVPCTSVASVPASTRPDHRRPCVTVPDADVDSPKFGDCSGS